MRQPRNAVFWGLVILLGISPSVSQVQAHDLRQYKFRGEPVRTTATIRTFASASRISGEGKMKFRVLYTASQLPEAASKVLVSAHGGFAVDRREGKGETYFALPGAGIIRISADLKEIRVLETPPEVKNVNLHGATIWYAPDGNPYLVFAANDAGKVFTTTLDGKLVHTLATPTVEDDFDNPAVNDYFRGKGNFVPTDVEELDGLYYVTTGYSNLDYILTARIIRWNPFQAIWNDLAFGGRGDGPGQFGTGHGITVPPGKKRLDVADRPHSRIERFTRYGQYRCSVQLPSGSLPCDVNFLDNYVIVPCLDGPDGSKGAPIYILEDDKIISTIMPKEELGLENFKHIHNAVLRKIGGKYYVIVQAWNPGDFAILEQVVE